MKHVFAAFRLERNVRLLLCTLLMGAGSHAPFCRAESPTESSQAPVVAATRIEREDLAREVSFTAELRPYQEVELHARVTGYLEALKVDSGDTVKEGALIGTLDVPELKSEI